MYILARIETVNRPFLKTIALQLNKTVVCILYSVGNPKSNRSLANTTYHFHIHQSKEGRMEPSLGGRGSECYCYPFVANGNPRSYWISTVNLKIANAS